MLLLVVVWAGRFNTDVSVATSESTLSPWLSPTLFRVGHLGRDVSCGIAAKPKRGSLIPRAVGLVARKALPTVPVSWRVVQRWTGSW